MRPVPDEAGLIVFLRLPEKGKVKTRLAATIGDDSALLIYNQLTSITLDLVSRLGIPSYLFFEGGLPPEEERYSLFSYHLQSDGDLGLKMANALAFVLRHHDKAVIIGSDCPDLSLALLRESLSRLDECAIILGPARDGGYYLLGCRKVYPSLFNDIAWSTSSVLEQTIVKITKEHLAYALLEELSDIDTAEDWNHYTLSGK